MAERQGASAPGRLPAAAGQARLEPQSAVGQATAPAIEPALGLLEFDSIAVGIEAGDAMAKRAPIEVLLAGTVHPGKYLVLVGGAVADVEESMAAGREVAGASLLDAVLLPNVHPGVTGAIGGARLRGTGEALGVIETPTVAAIIEAADAGLKGAAVRLLELRLADGLGGKGYLLFDGAVSDVEAAVEIGFARVPSPDLAVRRIIPQLHAEMRENLEAAARFGERARAPRASGESGSTGAAREGTPTQPGSGASPSSARSRRRGS